MTTPSDPWGQRPDSPETPTERIGEPGVNAGEHPGAHGPTESYQYPEPGPNATRALPPYQTQWGVYDTPDAYDTQWGGPAEARYAQGGPTEYNPTVQYGAGYGPASPPGPGPNPTTAYGPGDVPTEYGPAGMPVEPPRRSRRATWVAMSFGIFVVVVLAAAALGVFLANHDSSSSSSSALATTTSRPPAAQFPVFPQTPGGGIPSMPQLPGIDNLGATMGTVATNDGTTLTIDSLSGSTITVHTDARTQVISLGAGTLADLHTGDMVVVQGSKNPDGTILAKIIIGTAVPTSTTQVPHPTR